MPNVFKGQTVYVIFHSGGWCEQHSPNMAEKARKVVYVGVENNLPSYRHGPLGSHSEVLEGGDGGKFSWDARGAGVGQGLRRGMNSALGVWATFFWGKKVCNRVSC